MGTGGGAIPGAELLIISVSGLRGATGGRSGGENDGGEGGGLDGGLLLPDKSLLNPSKVFINGSTCGLGGTTGILGAGLLDTVGWFDCVGSKGTDLGRFCATDLVSKGSAAVFTG